MPCEKEFKKLIPKIYKWNFENISLFFFIKGQQAVNPKVKIYHAIESYFRMTDINCEEWDLLSAAATYHRMQMEYTDYKYSERIEKKNETSEKIT